MFPKFRLQKPCMLVSLEPEIEPGLCVAKINCFSDFCEGVSPAQAILGHSSLSGRRIERSTVFPAAKCQHDSARRSRRSKSPAPIPNQALICDCPARRGTICAFPILRRAGREKGLPFLNSLPTTNFASRDTHTYPKFLGYHPLTRL